MENITSKGTIFGTLIAQAGPKGDTGKTGNRGLTGEAGYSPIKGVDYFTQEDISEIRKGIEGDLTGEYNKNAIEKTNIFNTNAKETTTSFDLNAENKTKEYNDNALAEIEKYNSNAIEKSNNFDTNFENKTSKFDSNCDEKTKEFNDNNDLGIQNYNNNAKKQMEIFDTNFTEKLEAFNNNAGNKFNGFNTNSDKALAEYNKNHTAKMKEFDDNYDTKTKTFDDNAAAKLEAYNKNDEAKISTYNANDKAKTDAYNNNASNKEETFNTNAADKQNEFDENASDKLAEYNQNAKELINKVEQVQAENEALKAENKLIKEQIPSANVSGNSVHIEDSGTLDFDWKIRGGHKQETREGYNLLDFNVTQNSKVTVNEDGTLTINGAGGFSLNIDKLQLKAGITYYQKVELISGSISGANINNTFLSFAGAGKWISSEIFTESSFNEDTEKTVIWINASATFDNAVIKIWANTNKSDFEQYGASPSPDYPSEIETVGSNVNRFDIEKLTDLNMNLQRVDKNLIGTDVDFIRIGALYDSTPDISEKILAETYTISYEIEADNDVNLLNAYLCLKYVDGTSENILNSNSFNLKNGIKTKVSWKMQVNKIANTIAITNSLSRKVNIKIFNIKLEKGSVATPYSPYGMGSVEIDVINRNLIDNDSISGQYNCTVDNKIIKASNTSTSSWCRISFDNIILEADDYVISLKTKKNSSDVNYILKRISLYDKDNSDSTRLNFENINKVVKNEETLITIPIKITRKISSTRMFFQFGASITNQNIEIREIMISKGQNTNAFINKQSQTAIMPIQQEMLTGDYIRSVEHHKWEKIIIDTSKLIVDNTKEEKKKRYRYEYDKNIKKSDATNNVAYSNMFKLLGDGQTFFNVKGFTIANNNIYIYDEGESLTEFKSKITDKQLVFYVQLETSINLELTEEQKAIRDTKLYTYKNITNIAVSDELASIDVEYKKDLETEHNKLQNEIDEIKQLISTTETSALLLDNLQKDIETEVE